jgi:surfeit locus 1 family protein
MSSTANRSSARPSFKPGFWATIATLLGIALLLTLGTWQVQRLFWKTELIARAEDRLGAPPVAIASAGHDWGSLDFRHVRVSGEFAAEGAIGFGTAARDGILGSELLVPFRLPDGRLLLVDLGWIADAEFENHTFARALPAGAIELEGIARDRSAARPNRFTPSARPAEGRWYGWDLEAMALALEGELIPIVLTLDRPLPGMDAVRPSPVGVDYRNNHLGYALTWYGLAVGLLAVFVVFGRKRAEG